MKIKKKAAKSKARAAMYQQRDLITPKIDGLSAENWDGEAELLDNEQFSQFSQQEEEELSFGEQLESAKLHYMN